MRIGKLAEKSGLTTHTLRYYEKIGLIPAPLRNAAGRRDYDGQMLVWLEFLARMKTAGMPIRTMLVYARLRAAGPVTEVARHDLLVSHRAVVRRNLAALQDALAVLDQKIATYAAISPKRKTDAP